MVLGDDAFRELIYFRRRSVRWLVKVGTPQLAGQVRAALAVARGPGPAGGVGLTLGQGQRAVLQHARYLGGSRGHQQRRQEHLCRER